MKLFKTAAVSSLLVASAHALSSTGLSPARRSQLSPIASPMMPSTPTKPKGWSFQHISQELPASALIDSTSYAQHPSLQDSVHSALVAAKRELRLTYGLMQGNLLATLVLGMSCTTAFCLAQSAPLGMVQWASALAKSAIWFFFYGYHFDIANQLKGVEEDKLNGDNLDCKMNRPLATGEMSIGSGILYVAASWVLGGKVLTLQALWWVFTTFILNGTHASFGGSFAIKNYYGMSAGSSAMLLAARVLAGETCGNILAPIFAASYIGMIMDIQDFRDEEGDRQVDRKTTAVLLGVRNARKIWGVQFLAATAFFGNLVRQGLSIFPDGLIAVSGLALLVFTLRGQNAKDDDKSYKNLVLYGFFIYFRSAFWAQGI